jgi:flagellar protein FliO/FliZ
MLDLLFYVFLLALFALAVVAGLWFLRANPAGLSPMAALFGERPEKRLAVVEHANVDGRRRLVLIRRDGVEHLIMTGGPVDVVIETGIGQSSQTGLNSEVGAGSQAAMFSRPARTFGRASKPAAADVAE